MSGSASNIWKLRLSTEGADQVIRDLRAAATASEGLGQAQLSAGRALDTLLRAQPQLATGMERSEQALQKNIAAMSQMRGSYDSAGSSAGRLGQVMGQAGFQIQDFAVQVQGGTSALVALSQQGSQMLGVFGTGGAIAGAVLTVGLLAAQLISTRTATDELKDALDAQKSSMDQATEAAERYTSRLEDQGEALVRLGIHYRTATDAVRTFDAARVSQVQGNLTTQRNAIDNRLFGAIDSNIAAGQGVQQQFDPMGNVTGALTAATRNLTPGMEQARQALAEFRNEAVTTSDAIATLYNRFTTLDTGSAAMNARLREAAAGLMAAAPDMLRVADAQREAAVQFLAIREAAGASGQELDRYAQRFGNLAVQIRQAASSLNALRQGAIGGAEDRIAVEIQRNEAILRAVRTGGREAGEAMQELGTRQEQILRRASDLAEARQRQMVAAGRTTEEAREAVRELQGEFLQLATRAVDSGRAVATALERPASTRAISEIQEAYAELRRDAATGLLLISDSDARAAREISGQLRAGNAERDRLAREAERTATKAAEDAARVAQTAANSIESGFTGAFTRAFEAGANAGQSFLTSIKNGVKSLATTIASQLVFRMAVVPVVNAGASALGYAGNLLGTPNTALGGLNLGVLGGGAPVVSTAGSVAAAGQQAQQTGGLMMAGRYGNLGEAFTGTGLANTGFGVIDGALNTPLYGSGAAFQGPTLAGPPVAGIDGLTVAGGLGAGASILGGAYGIYSGLERGGIGGYTSAAGGALGVASGVSSILASLGVISASLGPIGWIGAAVLAIAGALMPGQKPSGMGQTAWENVDTGAEGSVGLTGKRFSQANLDRSKSATGQIADLARNIGASLGGAVFGSHVATGTTATRLYLDVAGRKADFQNDEAGAKALGETAGRYILQHFRENGRASGDYAGILNASGDSVETLSANLEWYEKVYKTFDQSAVKVSAYAQGLKALEDQFQPAIDKAASLGLSIERVTEARDRELTKLREQRDAQVVSIDRSYAARLSRVRGDGLTADLIGFDASAANEVKALRESLEQAGLTAEDVGYRITTAEQTLAEERLAIQKQYADQAAAIAQQAAEEQVRAAEAAARIAQQTAAAQLASAQSVLAYLNGQALGSTSSLSPWAKQSEAERQFQVALAGNDNGALTQAADALLTNSGAIYGTSTTAYVQQENRVRSAVANAGLRSAQASGDPAVTSLLAAMLARIEDMAAEMRRANNLALVA